LSSSQRDFLSTGTLARSHGHFDTLIVGTEVGVLVDKTSKTMAAVFGAEAGGGEPLNRAGPVSRPGSINAGRLA
jgi:hypothetical protein